MSKPAPHESPRPLIDPEQAEQAGRALRQWLERLRRPAPAATGEPDIDWEDGEPRVDRRDASAGR